MNDIKTQTGAAIFEFIVSLLFIVPLFMLFPTISKLISIKQVNIQSARYALWEKTVWSSYDGHWKDKENNKNKQTLWNELDNRFYSDPRAALNTQHNSVNHYWLDNAGSTMLVKKSKLELDAYDDYSPVNNYLSDQIAYEGFSNTAVLNYASSVVCQKNNDVDTSNGLNLGANTFTSLNVAISVRNTLGAETAQSPRFRFSSAGGILTNSWSVSTVELYADRVARLVPDKTIQCIVGSARLLSKLPFYKEGEMSKRDTLWLPMDLISDVQQ